MTLLLSAQQGCSVVGEDRVCKHEPITIDSILPLRLDLPQPGQRGRTRSLDDQLRTAIVDGRLAAGARLPATRELAAASGLSRSAVVLVYDALVAAGLLESRPGSGTFVASRGHVATPQDKRESERAEMCLSPQWRNKDVFFPELVTHTPYDFRVGIPDQGAFPHDIWRRLAAREMRLAPQSAGGYGNASGRLTLRSAIAAQVSHSRAVACSAGDIIVTSGAQQALDLLARILVKDRDCVVAVENPGYPSFRETFSAAGARIAPVDVDADGIRVDMIPSDARIVCVTPSHQYPLGSPLSSSRRRDLLQFARERKAVVIEDDYDGEFRYAGHPLDALKTLDRDESVFYVGTFSKCMTPALRLGYVVVPAWAHQALSFAKQSTDWSCPTLSQDVLAAFIAEGHLLRHVRRMRGIYQQRSALLVASLRRHLGHVVEPFAATAGLHIAALCRTDIDLDAVARNCFDSGVALRSINECWIGPPRWPVLGLGFGVLQDQHIDAAVRKLKAVAFS